MYLCISYLFSGAGHKKITSPERTGVGYKVFHGSTLITASAVTHWHCNGRTRPAISDRQLRSGIITGRGTDALHQTAPSLGIFPAMRVFITAFYTKNVAYFLRLVNPRRAGNPPILSPPEPVGQVFRVTITAVGASLPRCDRVRPIL